jgi:hypothetical protein
LCLAEEKGFDHSIKPITGSTTMNKRWEGKAWSCLTRFGTHSQNVRRERGWDFDHSSKPGWNWKFSSKLDYDLRCAYLEYLLKDDDDWDWHSVYETFRKIKREHPIGDWPHKQKFVKPFVELAHNSIVGTATGKRNPMHTASPEHLLEFSKTVAEINDAGMESVLKELEIDSSPRDWRLKAAGGFYNRSGANWAREVINCLRGVEGKMASEYREMLDHAEAEQSVSRGGSWKPLIEHLGPSRKLAERITEASSWRLKNDADSLADVANSDSWRRTRGSPLLENVTPSEIIMLADQLIPFEGEFGEMTRVRMLGRAVSGPEINWLWAGLMAIKDLQIYWSGRGEFYRSKRWDKSLRNRVRRLEKAFRNGELQSNWIEMILELPIGIEPELLFLVTSMNEDWGSMQEIYHNKESVMGRKDAPRNKMLFHKANAFAAIERKNFSSVVTHFESLKQIWDEWQEKTTMHDWSDMRRRWLTLDYSSVDLSEDDPMTRVIQAYIDNYASMQLDDESTKETILNLLVEVQSKKKMLDKGVAIEKMVAELNMMSWTDEGVRIEVAIRILKALGEFEKNSEGETVEFQELPAGATKVLREMYDNIIDRIRIRTSDPAAQNTGYVQSWRGLAKLFLNPEDEKPLRDEIRDNLEEDVRWAMRLGRIAHRRHISRLEDVIQSHDDWLSREVRQPRSIKTRENKKQALREEIGAIEKKISELE